jgi:hypothetical protein
MAKAIRLFGSQTRLKGIFPQICSIWRLKASAFDHSNIQASSKGIRQLYWLLTLVNPHTVFQPAMSAVPRNGDLR